MATQYPIHGQVDVVLNKPLVYIFSQALKESSVYSGSVVLYDAKDHHMVDGILSYDASTKSVQFLPRQALSANTSYTWSFAGVDDGDTVPIEFATGVKLAESIWIDFQTGSTVLLGNEGLPAGSNVTSIIEDGQTIEERASDIFSVVSTSPAYYDSEVDVIIDTISVTFSKDVQPGQDFDELLTLSYKPLLRETYYFNNNRFMTVTTKKVPGSTTVLPEAEPYMIPSGTWALQPDNRTVMWTKTDTKNFNANAFVHVSVSGDLKSIDDEDLNLSQPESFYFLTMLFPMYTTVESVLLKLAGIDKLVSEELILKYILTHSLTAHHYGQLSLITPTRAGQRFVECATVVSLIDNQALQSHINRGKAIRLGELNVQYELPRQPETDASSVRKEAAKCLEEAKREMAAQSGNGEFMGGERNVRGIAPFDQYRNMMNLGSNIPYNTGN